MFKTVLFPIDQSREAREAVDTVINIVQTYQSHLILLSVVEKQASDETPSGVDMMTSVEAVAKLLQGAQAVFAEKGIQTEILEKEGMPSFTICDVADEVNADLIIMGCRGLGLLVDGAVESATKSVTNRVINLSPCPVLVVP
mgnify:CR=1 FL=1